MNSLPGKVTTKFVVELEVEGDSIEDIQWGVRELARRLCVGRVFIDTTTRPNRRILITDSGVKPR